MRYNPAHAENGFGFTGARAPVDNVRRLQLSAQEISWEDRERTPIGYPSRGLCRAAIGAGSSVGQPSERLQMERTLPPFGGRVPSIAGSHRKQKKIYHHYAFA